MTYALNAIYSLRSASYQQRREDNVDLEGLKLPRVGVGVIPVMQQVFVRSSNPQTVTNYNLNQTVEYALRFQCVSILFDILGTALSRCLELLDRERSFAIHISFAIKLVRGGQEQNNILKTHRNNQTAQRRNHPSKDHIQ